jgi:hypothetical protein
VACGILTLDGKKASLPTASDAGLLGGNAMSFVKDDDTSQSPRQPVKGESLRKNKDSLNSTDKNPAD